MVTRLTVLLLVCAGAALHGQGQAPPLLLSTARCLAVKQFLPSRSAAKLTFGYLLDESSYPGDKVIYVVTYASPDSSNGLVFAVFLTTLDGRQTFNIQNNARFVLSKNEIGGVVFVDPPLGGIWTQQHLASAVVRIEKQPRFAILVKSLTTIHASARCESYTDPPQEGRDR